MPTLTLDGDQIKQLVTLRLECPRCKLLESAGPYVLGSDEEREQDERIRRADAEHRLRTGHLPLFHRIPLDPAPPLRSRIEEGRY